MSTRESFEWPTWRKAVLVLLVLVVAISWPFAIVSSRMSDKLLSLLVVTGAAVLYFAVPVPMRVVFDGRVLWLYCGFGRAAKVSPEDVRVVQNGLGFGGRAYIPGGVTLVLKSGRVFWVQSHFKDYRILAERLHAFARQATHPPTDS